MALLTQPSITGVPLLRQEVDCLRIVPIMRIQTDGARHEWWPHAQPREGCWQARPDTSGAGRCCADLPLYSQRTRYMRMAHDERLLSREAMKDPGLGSRTGATVLLGFEPPSNPLLCSWMTGGLSALCVMHRV